MSALSLTGAARLGSVAPLILRLVAGVIMAWHGYQKLIGGPAAFGGVLESLAVPAPVLMGWVVTLVELVGGVFLVVGLLTRLAALLLTLNLIGAIYLVKVDVGFITPVESPPAPGAELDLALIACFLAILVLGAGRLSLDHLFGIEKRKPVLVDPKALSA
ncbi:MAG: DoxX family protein [Actinomycetota bacterium]|nr:DoxX family protein [Actinomycetota bacterium]